MNAKTDIWTPHLRPGESIAWSADYSADIRRARRSRTRRDTAIVAIVSGVFALLAFYRLYEATVLHQGQTNLSNAVAIPLYVAFGIALGVLSVFMVRKLSLPPPGADHYAATNLRLLALDGHGKLVEEMEGADIGGAAFDNDRRPTELHIFPRNGDAAMFFIEHIEDLPAARARIIELFPEPAP